MSDAGARDLEQDAPRVTMEEAFVLGEQRRSARPRRPMTPERMERAAQLIAERWAEMGFAFALMQFANDFTSRAQVDTFLARLEQLLRQKYGPPRRRPHPTRRLRIRRKT